MDIKDKDKIIEKLKTRDRVVLIGNSHSVLNIGIKRMEREYFTIGCNRILYHMSPNAVLYSDRQPYWQMLGRIRASQCVNIFSRTIFDKSAKCRSEPAAPAFDGEYIGIDITTDGRIERPRFDFGEVFLPGPSVALLMIQVAVAAGYRDIGMLGINYDYGDPKKTHFYGSGVCLGAFTPDITKVMKLMGVINGAAKGIGCNIVNLSSVRGVMDSVFKHTTIDGW